jgi:hypothetical protein
MEKNMGKTDRIIRGLIAIVAFVLAIVFGLQTFNWLPIVLIIVGVIMGFTALVGICPLYMPFKISTKKAAE